MHVTIESLPFPALMKANELNLSVTKSMINFGSGAKQIPDLRSFKPGEFRVGPSLAAEILEAG